MIDNFTSMDNFVSIKTKEVAESVTRISNYPHTSLSYILFSYVHFAIETLKMCINEKNGISVELHISYT